MENKPGGHLSDRFTITPTNVSAYIEKETLKKNILAQEATFRKQVSELHRLYNVQKDLTALQCLTDEVNGPSQARSYSSPYGVIRTVHQVGPSVEHDMKIPSETFMKGGDLGCSSNGLSMSHINSQSTQKMLSLKVPDDAHADDSDDDNVVILSEKPAKSLPRKNSSIFGSNVKELQVPYDAQVDDSDDDVVILSETPAKSLPINNGSILGINVKGLQVATAAHAIDSDDDVVILSEKPTNSLPSNNGSSLGTNVKGLQVPTDAYVDDSDVDVVILLEKPAKSLPRNNDSMLLTNVKLNIKGSSHMKNNWITGLQPSDVSKVNVLNKTFVGSSSTMKTENFPSVGSSSSQNQSYSSAGVNLNLPNVKLKIEPSSCMEKHWVTTLQQSNVSTVNALDKKVVGSTSTIKTTNIPCVGTSSPQNHCFSSVGVNLNLPTIEEGLKENCVGSAVDSNFFVANEEARHNSSYIHAKYDRSNSMKRFAHKKDLVDSSTTHDQSCFIIQNSQIFAESDSNTALKSPCQSNSKDYTTMRHYTDTGMTIGQNGRLPKIQEYCRLHSPNISGGSQYQNHSPLYDWPMDVNLNNGPQDATATLGQAREDIPMEISWVKKRLLNMGKQIPMNNSQVPLSCVNGHSQISPDSMASSKGTTPSSMGISNMDMQFKNNDNTNARNRIDLNVALSFIDDMEIDARLSEGDTIPEEPVDPSNEAHVVTASKNLVVVHKDELHAGSPQGFEIADVRNQECVCSSTLINQEHKSSKDHGVSAATSAFNASDKANSTAATPLEGHYVRYPGL